MAGILMDIPDWRVDLIERSIRQEALLKTLLYHVAAVEAHLSHVPSDKMMEEIQNEVAQFSKEIALRNQM